MFGKIQMLFLLISAILLYTMQTANVISGEPMHRWYPMSVEASRKPLFNQGDNNVDLEIPYNGDQYDPEVMKRAVRLMRLG
ncbi:hypothetical protein EWB00_007275 [Schistosoma japonicum]|uniref:Uncharacterized protein n=1 Tax=Schistosoma japonicum TaxID=6182 RepID=C1LLE2_SCHJA|nr:hypothetical protein KSF78_0006108 [Schistosoma japonicum]TNN08175.1 hypothetical protein EWB00_007275 [Schistosoma japonicum]TNN08176.1 hypothetical protein EWB00_007275 [Schistosoma japonicum]CAX70595.1 hypothetical protein [Schistosoma japonicum]CAX75517.1 hypothetical protein [Schistosoma japonicum]